jgi:hypothetical protein
MLLCGMIGSEWLQKALDDMLFPGLPGLRIQFKGLM